ncbi:MAG TPA: YihY/virulence factor BrkB family protein [Casimicrobiaceae bacterium]|jgi:YihY family inner membrane protein
MMASVPAIRPSTLVVAHPLRFTAAVLASFRANQGLLLAGAVAYYTLLSLIPLLILLLIALSHVIDEARLLTTLSEYLEFVVPGQSLAIVDELRGFLAHREAIGGVLLASMILFSALAFTVLENAMSVIFFHRVSVRRRRFIVSALLPYVFIVFLGVGLLIVTITSGKLAALATHNVTLLGVPRSLEEISNYLLYLIGVAGEIFLLTAIYLVMPVGRLSLRHALIGGIAAGLLWELTRHVLVWYYGTISQIQVVYGSLTTAIAVLLSVEIAAIVLLLGAQVIAEYERIGREPLRRGASSIRT